MVPTAAVAEEVTRELLRRTGAFIGQAQALTFDGLVREVLGEKPIYIDEFQREILVAGILRAIPLSTLDSAVRFPGLVMALGSLLLQLAESGRTPEELDDIFGEWARREPDAALLAADLRRVADAYASACATAGAVDRPAAVRAACERTDGWSRPVAFYGFTSFTGGQRRLIEAIARRVPVMVAFDHDRDRSVNLAEPAEVVRWECIAGHVTELPPQPRAYSCPAISLLERRLFGADVDLVSPVAGAEGVRFLLAAGERNEAELVAQHVVQIINEGFAPEDIAIIVRDVSSRGRLMARVLESCGVPHRLDAGLTLAETGLGHAFLNAVAGVAQEDSDALLDYLRGPYSGLTWDESADLERRYRRGGAGDFRALAAITDAEAPQALASIRRALREGDSLSLEPAALHELACEMLAAGLEGGRAFDAQVEEDARAFDALRGALLQLEGMARDESLSVGIVLDTALGCLARVRVRREGTSPGRGVSILTPARARARRFAVVFIVGLVAGEFPARADRPSLLTEAHRRGLEAVAGGGLVAQKRDDEEALFVSAISRAWQVLYLSARDADDGGGEVLPSHFWTQAKELLGRGVDEHEKRSLSDVVFAVENAPAPRYYRRARAAAGAGGGDYSWRRSPASLRDPAVLAELAAGDCFSPSTLESYLSCPFAWFLQRLVGIEDFTQQLDGRIVGNLLHSALSRVYQRIQTEGRSPLRQEDVSWAFELGRLAVDELAARKDCPGTGAERRVATWRVKQLLRTLLLMEAAWGSRLVTVDTEVQVGGDGGVDIGGVSVRGRVDRIDADPDGGGLFVVDYKSGKVPSSKRIGTEEGLQLPLYLLALGAERTGEIVLGGAYLSPAERKRSGIVLDEHANVLGLPADGLAALRVLPGEEAEELYEAVRATAIRAAEAIRSGAIAPLGDRTCPPWCDLRSACRAHRGRAGA